MKKMRYLIVIIELLGLIFIYGCRTNHEAEKTTSNSSDIYEFSNSHFENGIEWFNHYDGIKPKQFPTFAQCQFDIAWTTDPMSDLPVISESAEVLKHIQKCIDIAVKENVDVLIFPELTLALPEQQRLSAIENFKHVANQNNMIIIGGSFYDKNRFSRVPIFGPNWSEFGYKFRPSRSEVSIHAEKGMQAGPALPVVKTDNGTFLILTCVDMISDEAQYLTRNLASSQQIQVVINNCYNPAALEFLMEANSLTRRHPIFVLVTNVIDPTIKEDGPYAFGHTALLANIRNTGNTPHTFDTLINNLPDSLVVQHPNVKNKNRHIAFDNVVADLGHLQRAMLIYDLNMNLTRIPKTTNAPDQGYPPVRNLRVISLDP